MSRLFTYVVLVPLVAIIIFAGGLHYGLTIKPKCEYKKPVRIEHGANCIHLDSNQYCEVYNY